MKTDIQIAQECKMQRIEDVASSIGVEEKYVEKYGEDTSKWTEEAAKEYAEAGFQAIVDERKAAYDAGMTTTLQ